MDHANLDVGTVVRMHEHRNDEILSYMWRGKMVHEDSTGQAVSIGPRRLMMMNAGKSFWHEESTPDVPVEMLQIFIRPRNSDLPGQVQFFDRPDDSASGSWILIAAAEGEGAPLSIRQDVTVYDAHLRVGESIKIPHVEGLSQWLYVMDGEISIGGDSLQKGDAVTDFDDALPPVEAKMPTGLVLFLVNRNATASLLGTISGR
jgi:redox-sensitive bicupin YhaK (pirin superfamily)